MKNSIRLVCAILATGMILFACKGGEKSAAQGPVKITVEIFDRGTDGGKTDPTNNKWTQWIHDKLLKDENIDVSFVSVPRWTEAEALVNLFASNSAPDVCYTYSSENIQNWADQGGLFDLSPHTNTTLKDLNEFLGPDAAIPGKRMIERQVDLSTGKIFSIPARRMNLARTIAWIREDWLQILGIPEPKTTQEYYNTLAAFRDRAAEIQQATGVSRVIPFITDGDRLDWNCGLIMDSFIDVNISEKERWINGVVERNLVVPGYKEGVRFMNKLYNEGLIDRDFPLYKSGDDTGPVVKSGAVGSWVADWDTIYREPNGLLSGLKANVPSGNIIPVDCITDANGKTTKTIYDAAGVFYFIPLSCKNPDAAMRYLNWLSKYENYHFIQTGEAGVNHVIENGVVKVAADPKTLNPANDQAWMMNSNQNIDYTLMMNGLFLETQEASILALAAGYAYPADLLQRAYSIALTNGRPAHVVKTTSPLTAAAPVSQTLVDKAKIVYSELFRCPPAQFDSRWDTLISDWLASGAQAVIDERKAKYPN